VLVAQATLVRVAALQMAATEPLALAVVELAAFPAVLPVLAAAALSSRSQAGLTIAVALITVCRLVQAAAAAVAAETLPEHAALEAHRQVTAEAVVAEEVLAALPLAMAAPGMLVSSSSPMRRLRQLLACLFRRNSCIGHCGR
jgi:hypothetical protein